MPKGYKVVVYRTNSHQGYFTYDGIDVCGTRVAVEVMNEINRLNVEGVSRVTKMSIAGYSLGGVISRYAIGLLHKRGVFDDIEPVIFTTFCSPHVGARVLGDRFSLRVFNGIGTYALSSTSQQLFLKDNYHQTGLPLLQHMTEPQSIYFQALSKFTKRVNYANVENDNRCAYYTAAFEHDDPFAGRASFLKGPFVPGYGPSVIDGSGALQFSQDGDNPRIKSVGHKIWTVVKQTVRSLVTIVRVAVVIPVWFVAFLINATYQHIRSAGRVKKFRSTVYGEWEHESAGPTLEERLEEEADEVVDSVYETLNREQSPTSLALRPYQKTIIDGLNSLEWHKYPVHITLHKHAHAAVIVRYKHSKFEEGKVIVRHWIEKELANIW